MPRFRHAMFGTLAALIALVIAAAPVVGRTVISQSGTRGSWSLTDTLRRPGVTCDYNIYGDLYQLRVKPPNVFGAYAAQTWVGWRYKIMRRTATSWREIDVSDVQRDLASSSVAADGFAWRTWDGFGVDPPANARYKVRLVILFYAPSSSTTVAGKVVVEDDWYKETYPTWDHPFKHAEYCSNTPD